MITNEKLDRYLKGTLPEAEIPEVEQQIESDPELADMVLAWKIGRYHMNQPAPDIHSGDNVMTFQKKEQQTAPSSGSGSRTGWYAGGLAAAALLAVGLYIFVGENSKPAGPPPIEGVVTFVKGKAEIKTPGAAEFVPVQISQKVGLNAIVRTAYKSRVILQMPDVGVVRVLPKSEVQISQLNESNTRMHLNKGGVFSNLKKLKKGQSFRVSTPTSVAAVRGTRFLVLDRRGKSEYFVSDGKIAVRPKEAGQTEEQFEKDLSKEDGALDKRAVAIVAGKTPPPVKQEKESGEKEAEKVLKAGSMAVVKDKPKTAADEPAELVETRKLNYREATHLTKYEISTYKDNVEAKSAEELEAEGAVEAKEEANFKQKNQYKLLDWDEAKLTPLDKLRAQGLPLTKLYLIGGEVLIGHIFEQDAKIIKLNTGTAKLTIPKQDIKKREFLK